MLTIALTATCATWAPAQQSQPAATEPAAPTRQELLARYRGLMAKLPGQFEAKQYAEALDTLAQLRKLDPRNPVHPYNQACALARLGKTEEAMAALAEAMKLGYADPDGVQKDEDLQSLRGRDGWADLIRQAEDNRKKVVEGTYEEGAEIAGVRTVEGRCEGGLRWRLRMSPAATKDKPDRLIVWLHPSGGSMNRPVEALAPELTKRGWAVMVLTQKQFKGWTAGEIDKLLDATLPDVAKVAALDASRPVLLGYSAGGQAALQVWQKTPDRLGGLVLDAAYPIMQTARGSEVMKLEASPALAKVPLFVLVGEKDGGAAIWNRSAPTYAAAGVPLTVHYVPDKAHTWLFDPARLKLLCQWLEQVKPGKCPSNVPPATQPAGAPEQ